MFIHTPLWAFNKSLAFLTLLENLLMNVYFVRMHVLVHLMPALHTTKEKKCALHLWCTSKFFRGSADQQMNCFYCPCSSEENTECTTWARWKKKCLSLHLALWQTTVLPRAVTRESGGERETEERWEIKGERERYEDGERGKEPREQKVDRKSTEVEDCTMSVKWKLYHQLG